MIHPRAILFTVVLLLAVGGCAFASNLPDISITTQSFGFQPNEFATLALLQVGGLTILHLLGWRNWLPGDR